MARGPHVAERLDQRALPQSAEKGFELLRDPRALRAFLEKLRAKYSAVQDADRVALPLSAQSPAHLLVSRDGHGVTCLGAGMALNVPVIPFADVQAFLDERAADLRMAMASQKLATDDTASLLKRAMEYAYKLTRPEFDALRALSPLTADFYAESLKDLMPVMENLLQPAVKTQGAPIQAKFEKLWKLYCAAAMGIMSAGHEPQMIVSCAMAGALPDTLISRRGLWITVNHWERTLRSADSMISMLPKNAWTVLFRPLLAIACRVPEHRGLAAEAYRRAVRAAGLDPARAGLELFDLVGPRHPDAVATTVLMMPIWLKRFAPKGTGQRLSDDLATSDSPLKLAMARRPTDLKDLLAHVDPWFTRAMELWDPFRAFQMAPVTSPTPWSALNKQARVRVRMWKWMLRDYPVPPVGDAHWPVILSTAAPMEALIPGEYPDPAWRLSRGVHDLEVTIPRQLELIAHAQEKTVRRAEAKVARNDACPCGSGLKYKKCHGAAS